MKRVRILVIGLVVFSAGVNLSVAQERPVPSKPPKGEASLTLCRSRTTPSRHASLATTISTLTRAPISPWPL